MIVILLILCLYEKKLKSQLVPPCVIQDLLNSWRSVFLTFSQFSGGYKVTPNRQPTLLLHDLCLEVLKVYGNELRMYWAKAFLF